jgi:MFS family permease
MPGGTRSSPLPLVGEAGSRIDPGRSSRARRTFGSLLLELGTAMVYPSLIAAVSDGSHPTWRARSLSVYRFWRDLGYAIGALSAGLIADFFGFAWAIASIAALTFVSGTVVAVMMHEHRR